MDVNLVIEVGLSSLAFDRDKKIPYYARTGVSETWLVDLELQQVQLFRSPTSSGYAVKSIARRGERIAPQAFPDAAVLVDELLA
jgi:Uma2 family endonuclease